MNTSVDKEIHEKAKREARKKRELFEMEMYDTLEIGDTMKVMKVLGGWIYYDDLTPSWACFVPDRRHEI